LLVLSSTADVKRYSTSKSEKRYLQINMLYLLTFILKNKVGNYFEKKLKAQKTRFMNFHCAKATVDDHTGPGGVISLRCTKSHFRLNPRTRRSDFSIKLTDSLDSG
jgi:hypothetical protein